MDSNEVELDMPAGFNNGRGRPIMFACGTDNVVAVVVAVVVEGTDRCPSLLNARWICLSVGSDDVRFEIVGWTGFSVGDVAGED